MREFLNNLGISMVALMIAAALVVAMAVGGIIWTCTIGVAQKDAEREAYKATAVYNEGVLDDLAKYRYEYGKASDDMERAAIAQLVASRFANYDVSRIEDESLAEFLETCRNGED